MTDIVESEERQWPSIDDHYPHEEGGPVARAGLSYQDDISVSIFLEAIEDGTVEKIHCETHDDLAVKKLVGTLQVVEYIQVKSNEPDSLWSVAALCAHGADSVCAKSLARDHHKEESRFRIVTLRDVNADLKLMTYPCYGPGRETTGASFLGLSGALKEKLPDLNSDKGNGLDYWLEHCRWHVCHGQDVIRQGNRLKILTLAASQGVTLLPEQAEVLEGELRVRAYDAGRAFWIPDKAKKIISRSALLAWWTKRLDELSTGTASPSGSRLREKMDEAGLSEDQIRMALELRREYAQMARTPRYMAENDILGLQRRVKSELASLRAAQMAEAVTASGPAFHLLCLNQMDAINQASSSAQVDQSAFVKGCMYDIADRCLHRFTRQRS